MGFARKLCDNSSPPWACSRARGIAACRLRAVGRGSHIGSRQSASCLVHHICRECTDAASSSHPLFCAQVITAQANFMRVLVRWEDLTAAQRATRQSQLEVRVRRQHASPP